MEINLKIADDSVAARNIERFSEMQQLSREEAALRLLEKTEVSQGATPAARRIIGVFNAPENAKIMDEAMELIMEDRRRINDGLSHDQRHFRHRYYVGDQQGYRSDRIVTQNAVVYLSFYLRLTFTSVSVYEVVYGLEAKNATRQLTDFLESIPEHEELTTDGDDYRLAATIRAKLQRVGNAHWQH